MCISLRLFIMFMALAECRVYSSCFCVVFFLLCVQQKHPFSFAHPCLRSAFVTTTKRCVRQPMVSMFNVVSTTLFLRLPLETSRSIKHMAQNELMVNCMMAHHSRSRRHTYLNTHHRQSRSQHNIKKMVGRSWDTPREKRHDMTAHTHTQQHTFVWNAAQTILNGGRMLSALYIRVWHHRYPPTEIYNRKFPCEFI